MGNNSMPFNGISDTHKHTHRKSFEWNVVKWYKWARNLYDLRFSIFHPYFDLLWCCHCFVVSIFFFCVVSSLLSILRYTIPYRWAEKERQTITKWHADTNTFPHAMLYRYSTSIRRYITYYYTNIYVWYYSYRKKQRRSRKKKRWWKRKKKRLWSQYTAAQKAHRVQVVASHLTNISNQM